MFFKKLLRFHILYNSRGPLNSLWSQGRKKFDIKWRLFRNWGWSQVSCRWERGEEGKDENHLHLGADRPPRENLQGEEIFDLCWNGTVGLWLDGDSATGDDTFCGPPAGPRGLAYGSVSAGREFLPFPRGLIYMSQSYGHFDLLGSLGRGLRAML